MKILTRMSLLAWLCAAVAMIAIPSAAQYAQASKRKLEFYNVNTKEEISVTYKRNGQYVDAAVKKLDHFLRDWRRDKSIKMDRQLYDIIWEIHQELGSKKPIHLISGYRSPKTNALLRKTKGGQAKKSRHMTGQAADIHFPDIPVKELRNSALIRERGGVGYYPTSAIPFVHVDTGRVRHWPRLPRKELAILFPEGKSRHIPSDGKPLKKKDFKVALAQLKKRGGKLPVALQAKLNDGRQDAVVVASLTETPAVPVPVPAPEVQKVQPGVVLASLSPFDGLAEAIPSRKPDPAEPIVEVGLTPAPQLTPENGAPAPGGNSLTKPPHNRPSANVPQDQISSSPEYDDDHPDELYYHPVPIAPFLSDTPVAEMDMTSENGIVSLADAHTLFGESRQMLVNQFEPGLQYAKLYWAQQFRGTAVNTRLKRLVRGAPADQPAAAVAATEQKTRTARK